MEHVVRGDHHHDHRRVRQPPDRPRDFPPGLTLCGHRRVLATDTFGPQLRPNTTRNREHEVLHISLLLSWPLRAGDDLRYVRVAERILELLRRVSNTVSSADRLDPANAL